MKTWKQWLRKYGVTVFLLFGIFLMSATPGKIVHNIGMGNEIYHIKGHFIMYGFLYFSLYKSTLSQWKSFFGSVLYGVLMEIMQIYIPGRACEFKDMLVNSFGASLALAIVWIKSLFPLKKPQI